ncbi:NAD(P)-binding domain-containing protein [Corynebacterium sp. c6VSa_13]|nr:NAD(P)-binding domain-containing protein [Corynebacterium sp. c6VSa_13]
MGTELARHLLDTHHVTVWNRTADKTQPLIDAGASRADSPSAAIADADVIITSLFGPDTVREIITTPGLIPADKVWIDTTTISPADAAEFAAAHPRYVHAPVVGTLGPARDGKLGVYVGSTDTDARALAAEIVAPWAAANPQRLREVDTAPKAATGKLLANLALAVSAEGLKEALLLGAATDTPAEEVLDMLEFTGLAFIKNMKAPFVLGQRDTDPGDFTVDAIAKDARLMLDTAGQDLPALHAALDSLEGQQHAERGNQDFSAMVVYRDEQ